MITDKIEIKDYEILPNFKVDISYIINEHNGKKIPTIIDVVHEKISIFVIVKSTYVDLIRSNIFKEINDYL